METKVLTAEEYIRMLRQGAEHLSRNVGKINDLNVFPIPDGDTGDNMLLTIRGGLTEEVTESVGETARQSARGMLFSARGNSGVILSQFFEGIAEALPDTPTALPEQVAEAVQNGVKTAYRAVLTPTEGTILTVMREAALAAAEAAAPGPEEYLEAFLTTAGKTLRKTPDLLPVLKEAGVVDSGGAGLICIFEGMLSALKGTQESFVPSATAASGPAAPDFDRFGEDSTLEFGYCTELLVRLMRAKCNPETFDTGAVTDYLQSIGNSVVAFLSGSILKIHVHTFTPGRVLDFCQTFGEFLSVKIENMSLQHNNLTPEKPEEKPAEPVRKKIGVVSVASGQGIRELFASLSCDAVVDGGQSMNPSAAQLIETARKIGAETVFLLPNNGNVVLSARQAASLCEDVEIRVIPTKSIGQGYAALSLFDPQDKTPDEVEEEMLSAISGVVTAAVSVCSREAENGAFHLHEGQYIGFSDGEVLAVGETARQAAENLCDALDFTDREVALLLYGAGTGPEDAEAVREYLCSRHPRVEMYCQNGGQPVYDYLLILE